MKFRNKVLIINMVLLSAALGIVGYLMIRRNFDIVQETGLSQTILGNHLVQSSVEYDLLQVLNEKEYQTGTEEEKVYQIRNELEEIGRRITSSTMVTDITFYIRYDDQWVYGSDGRPDVFPMDLFYNLKAGEKKYLFCKEGERNFVYVTSCSLVGEKFLYVVNKSDISENYSTLEEQIWYFRLVILLVLAAASLLMTLVSRYLTRHLEQLAQASGQIARENYSQRVSISSEDEVGQLAEQFNNMAEAVEDHVIQLREMVRSREQFVADFTHEIKTPMTAIIGYADTMRSLELPRKEQLLALNYIFSEGKRLEDMSGKLFELLCLGRTKMECMPVHVTDLITEVLQITEPIVKKKGITLVHNVEEAVITVNKELFVTVLVNLIDNSCKASEPGGEIQISGSCTITDDDPVYQFSIRDRGIGMNEEEIKRMCDEFYMADKSRSRKEGGAGIGMSLVSLILEKHGAEWETESEPGIGTTIRIRVKGASM